jgi:hypothetical protein
MIRPDLYFAPRTLTERDLSGLGRETLVKGLIDMHAGGRALVHERNEMLANLTATQHRCTELLMALRASKIAETLDSLDIHAPDLLLTTLVALAAGIATARRKHPEGPDGMRCLAEEVGEVASALRRETPARVREELLDVAVVAIRWHMSLSEAGT